MSAYATTRRRRNAVTMPAMPPAMARMAATWSSAMADSKGLMRSAIPKRIDITLTKGPDKGKKKLGIYDLKGDTLRFCVGPVGGERPKEFIGKPMPSVWMEEWKRVK